MRSKRSIFKPKSKASYRMDAKGNEATVYIYDEIGWFGVEAAPFAKDLAEIKADTIHLRINSPGGSVFDGMAIYNSLKQHPAKIITHIDGLAASISSVIALAGDEVVMGEGAYLMIHSPWSTITGDAEDMRREADLLDKVAGSITELYQNKTGLESEEITDMMRAETWFTGAEALANHFIDRVETSEKAKNKAILFDLSVFANTPESLLDEPEITERGLEKALRDAGCSRNQAKTILSTGLPDDFRDAENTVREPEKVLNLRDAEETEQREAVKPEKKVKDKVAELLIRAEQVNSTLNTEENK